jgi:hypothetical protein
VDVAPTRFSFIAALCLLFLDFDTMAKKSIVEKPEETLAVFGVAGRQ